MQWGLPHCRPQSWGLGGCWEGGRCAGGGWGLLADRTEATALQGPHPQRGPPPREDVPGLVTSGLESLSLSGGVGKVDPVAAKN